MDESNPDQFTITYEFSFADGHTRSYKLCFDRIKIRLIPQKSTTSSPWTQLDFNQCSHCPLSITEGNQCPITVHLEQLIDYFKDEISHHQCSVKVHTCQRTYLHKVSVQEGLYSIFGLIMATSGCPHMEFLKPMAYFHLPFASVEETIVRAISLYLLKQYYRWKHEQTPDWKLEKLEQHYQNVRQVNEGIIRRIRSLQKKGDADVNALVILDDFALNLDLEISEGLEEYTRIFLEDLQE